MVPPCSTGHISSKKKRQNEQRRILGICVSQASERRRYGPTDGRTDGRTDRSTYRDARTHLKRSGVHKIEKVFFPRKKKQLKWYCLQGRRKYISAKLGKNMSWRECYERKQNTTRERKERGNVGKKERWKEGKNGRNLSLDATLTKNAMLQ